MLQIRNFSTVCRVNKKRTTMRLDSVLSARMDYCRIVNGPLGMQRYGVWMHLIALASRTGTEGYLSWDGTADGDHITLAEFAALSYTDIKIYDDAIAYLIDIGVLVGKSPALFCLTLLSREALERRLSIREAVMLSQQATTVHH